MSNKKEGDDFENEFRVLAGNYGFWAHRMNVNREGQPADIILCKNNIPVLVDCKDCKNKVFKLSRIEDNQEYAMTKWLERGNKYALFALKVDSEIFIISFSMLITFKQLGYKQLNYTQIKECGKLFSEWVGDFDACNSQ